MMVDRSWTVREGTANDLAALRDLYVRVWGYNRPYDYDQWRYLSSPLGICPMAFAVVGKRIVGAYTLWPVTLRVDGSVVAGGQSMDTMTDPEFGRQGIFTTLAESCYEIAAARGLQVLYGFPNPNSYPGFTKKLGWRHTGDMTHWVRPIRPSQHPRVPGVVSPLVDLAVRALPKGRRHGLDVKLARPSAFEFNGLIDDMREDFGVYHVARSADWFEWRYAEAAENNYRWLSAYRDGVLVAAAAWGSQSAAWQDVRDNRGHLVEILGADREGLQAAVSAAIDDAMLSGVVLLETICNVVTLEDVLRRAGFFRHRQAPFIVRGLGERAIDSNILNHTDWRIMGGDIDTF